ncbi:MFS transporter [Streptomyces sp. NP160]|uniref:MFS transporter n=1 Tax=Streptomyces sp. NP160 TaxID=2586637 RepID=UPI00214B0AD0|nr:MFS transporter [Streptomyces sp. NP160]
MSASPQPSPTRAGRRRVHPAWGVAAVAFVALVGAAGFRAAPGVLMVPLHDELGWSTSLMSLAVSLNLVLFGLTAPFAAALMERFGMRRVVACALLLIAAGAALSSRAQAAWQLLPTWGLLIGLGTGSMALVFAATVADRWFVRRRGLVIGVLTAGSATGQLSLLPVVAWASDALGWRTAVLVVAAAALAVVPLVLLFLRDRPLDLGVLPYGAQPAADGPLSPLEQASPRVAPERAPAARGAAAARAVRALREASRRPAFWALAGAFAICGATTNGLVGVHFVPSAHDHGMATTTAAGLLAVVGVFDIAGTIASGYLTDRFDPRLLLLAYYAFRGVGLLVLPWLLGPAVHPSMLLFVVVYGLDWVATVPPTAVLCRELFGSAGTVVFGWVFASHQVGAAVAAGVAGVLREQTGTYTAAWVGGAALCAVAAVLSVSLRRAPRPEGVSASSSSPA